MYKLTQLGLLCVMYDINFGIMLLFFLKFEMIEFSFVVVTYITCYIYKIMEVDFHICNAFKCTNHIAIHLDPTL